MRNSTQKYDTMMIRETEVDHMKQEIAGNIRKNRESNPLVVFFIYYKLHCTILLTAQRVVQETDEVQYSAVQCTLA